jgi:hypothetical protein
VGEPFGNGGRRRFDMNLRLNFLFGVLMHRFASGSHYLAESNGAGGMRSGSVAKFDNGNLVG